MGSFTSYFWLFVGAGIGGALRHGANRASVALVGLGFPAGTLFVNLAGCFAMGVLASLFAFRGEWFTQHSRLFLTTGILGGFTTFSAFSLDAAVIWERGQTGLASTYVLVSLAGSLVGVFVGLWVGRVIFR